jgi:hypothetical protein
MSQVQSLPGGTVVAFRSTGHKTRRPAASTGEGRGAILLFTGIRYERTHVEASPLALSAHSAESAKPAE